MNTENRNRELEEFVNTHDLDEDEYEALAEWVNEGNSPYTNPDHYCMNDEEISFMNWYWILADPRHPEHSRLAKHRNWINGEEGQISKWPELFRTRVEEVLNMDYKDSTLKPGQDWYMGYGSFLSLEETKEHLLVTMDFLKDAFRKLVNLEKNAEDFMSELNLTGNLYEDVLTLSEFLSGTEIWLKEFVAAAKAADRYEEQFCEEYLNRQSEDPDYLPF